MSYKARLIPSGKQFLIDEGTSILDAAASEQLNLPHSCRDGSCGSCKSMLRSGRVTHPDDCDGITAEELEAGYVLSCVATADSDIELESDWYPELQGIKPALYPCKVDNIRFPVRDIAILQLRLPPASTFNYLPGQYLDLIWKGVRRSYSIANTCQQSGLLELHIRKLEHGVFSDVVFNQLKAGALLRLEGPHGTFFMRDSTAPILFVAGGTGFAPIKAMIEQLLGNNSTRLIRLYWGGTSEDHLYSELPAEWQKKYQNFSYIPVISSAETRWAGRRGLVHQAVLEDYTDLQPCEAYVCGSPDMIKAAKSDFLQKGLLVANFYSDAFTAHKPNN